VDSFFSFIIARMSSPRGIHTLTPSYGIALLLIAFIALGAIYAVVTPLFEISDELWHYPMVKTLADGNGLPIQDPANVGPWRQEGSQPPLYYLLMAFITRWIDTGDIAQVRWINPHADNGIITQDRNNNIVIHTTRENWPWSGTVLAVRLIRLLSVLLGAGTVYFTYRLALELMPEQKSVALASAAFAAFTPMFLFITASVNNDNLAIFCSAGALWLLARWLRSPPRKVGWLHIWLGVLLGCGALSKQSALGLWPLAGAVLVYTQFFTKKQEGSKSLGFGIWDLGFELLIVFGLALLLSFWWYWRNVQLYGDWLGWNTFIAIVGRRPHPATLAQLWGERVGFVQAYWGLFGGVSVPMPAWTYTILNLVMGLAMIGMGWGAVRSLIRRRMNLTETALWALPVVWVVLIVIGLIRWTSLTWASQGRLIFPAISAISVLMIVGLSELSRLFRLHPAKQSFILPVITFMALLSAAVPFIVIAPHYAPPPELTPAQIAAIPNRVDADFGGEMTLLGYALHTEAVKPGGVVQLMLYWQSQIAMDRNWSIFVHVVDADGVIAAQRDRYPGQGALAATLLQPGQTFADEYAIPIPQTAYSPIEARLVVGLYDLTDGARLALPDGRDALALASLPIQAHVADVPNPLAQNFGNLIRLAGYNMGPRALRPGETLELTLYWRALAPIRENYAVFAHVRGEGETLWAGEDAWPQKGAAPTSGWRMGDLIPDSYLLTLKPDTPPGLYEVEVGLYDSGTLERLRMMDAEGLPTDADFLFLSKVRVLP
jgi:4-amino-4-deoxy-L-arabinose transferase-like glycosyltransferase